MQGGEPEGPQPVRPIRYPARLPPNIDTLLAKTDDVLNGLREQLKQHVEAGVKQLRSQVSDAQARGERPRGAAHRAWGQFTPPHPTCPWSPAQVIRAYRLVEHAPGVAMAALAAHELQAARKDRVSSRTRRTALKQRGRLAAAKR